LIKWWLLFLFRREVFIDVLPLAPPDPPDQGIEELREKQVFIFPTEGGLPSGLVKKLKEIRFLLR
jgi:hypothetical protein